MGTNRPKGAKRSPEQLARVQGNLLAHIKANPGHRIEEIANDLKAQTKDLALPAKKLIALKKIKTKGQKRSTTYWPR